MSAAVVARTTTRVSRARGAEAGIVRGSPRWLSAGAAPAAFPKSFSPRRKSPVRDVMKVARHFSAGYRSQDGVRPVGTIEPAPVNAFKRPYRTRRFAWNFPGTKVPGYLQFVPPGLPEPALKGPPEIAQGWSEALTLGLRVIFPPALKGRSSMFNKGVRAPLQGLLFALPLTQGSTLGYVRSPRWGCRPHPIENLRARRPLSRRDKGSVAGGKASPRATPPEPPQKAIGILKGCQHEREPAPTR
jgi:hypothetical protein